MGCPVCEHPRAIELMQKVFSGDLTYVDVAKVMNLPVKDVWSCFAEHWAIEADGDKVSMRAMDKIEKVEDFVFQLRKTLKKFIARLDNAMAMPVSAYNESAVTKLSSELRALMRDILEFEGKLHAAPMVQLNIVQMQMTKLTSFLFSELCEADRNKLLAILPELQEAKLTT